MCVFDTPSTGYKVGWVGLLLCTVLYIVGYGSPYWLVAESFNQRLGLWMFCNNLRGCYSLGVDGYDFYFHWVRLQETLGLMGLLAACIYGMIVNCCTKVPRPFSRRLEILTALGGGFGLIGTIVFFIRSVKLVTGALENARYGFAIYLSTAACVCAYVCCFIIALNNKNPMTPGGAGDLSLTGGQVIATNAGPQFSSVVVQNSQNAAVSSSSYPSAPQAYYYGPTSSRAAGGGGMYNAPYPATQQQCPPTYSAANYSPPSAFPSK